jgi:hypothetical protein
MLPASDRLAGHSFLAGMYSDGYFPSDLVDKLKVILVDLCVELESKAPISLDVLLLLSHRATERINELGAEFEERGSEIETVAREVIAQEFSAIADAYGFTGVNVEELIAPRDW